jgi:opacity protein-like surface antigen
MTTRILQIAISCLTLVVVTLPATAQDSRAQYPRFLSRSYVGLNMGYIDYGFSAAQLEPDFQTESVHIPHLALQVLLLGYRFNEYLSAQINYMRPVKWVEYKVNTDQHVHYVRMNIAGLTVKSRLPVTKKFSAYGEAGLGIITRKGFKLGEMDGVKDANYASLLLGAGLQYRLNKNWDLKLSAAYSPPSSKANQPYMAFYSTGFNYNLQPLSDDRVQRNSSSGYIFPKNLIQLGYSTNHFSYSANDFVSKGSIPIFWGGEAEVAQGISIHYQRNIFHGRKLFSLDWGVSFSYWKSRKNKEDFCTLSVFPVFRFSFLHTKPADFYFYYSVAGPTYISKTTIDSVKTGKRFTFQDLMGIGTFIGRNRHINTEVRIGHYSNGNIFPDNEGVKIPLTFNVGYTF